MGVLLAPAGDSQRASTEPSSRSADALFQAFPLYFIENRGQVEEPVGFYLEGREASVYFTPGGVTYALTGQGAVKATAPSAHEISHSAARSGAVSRWAVKLDFVGADGTCLSPNCPELPRGALQTLGVVRVWRTPAPSRAEPCPAFVPHPPHPLQRRTLH